MDPRPGSSSKRSRSTSRDLCSSPPAVSARTPRPCEAKGRLEVWRPLRRHRHAAGFAASTSPLALPPLDGDGPGSTALRPSNRLQIAGRIAFDRGNMRGPMVASDIPGLRLAIREGDLPVLGTQADRAWLIERDPILERDGLIAEAVDQHVRGHAAPAHMPQRFVDW